MQNDEEIELSKPEKNHVEILRPDQLSFEIPDRINKIVDRKFDRHIVPWLFGIWCVDSPAKTKDRQQLTTFASEQAVRLYRQKQYWECKDRWSYRRLESGRRQVQYCPRGVLYSLYPGRCA